MDRTSSSGSRRKAGGSSGFAASHHLTEKAGCVVPVPVHGTADIGKGLLAEIERQTGVKFKG
jgi:hypothetical protein